MKWYDSMICEAVTKDPSMPWGQRLSDFIGALLSQRQACLYDKVAEQLAKEILPPDVKHGGALNSIERER